MMTRNEWDSFLYDESIALARYHSEILQSGSTWPYPRPLPDFLYSPSLVRKKGFWRSLFDKFKGIICLHDNL